MTVPIVKQSRDTLIKNTLINHSQDWKSKIRGQVNYYKKHAPFFPETKEILENILSYETNSISELNIAALDIVCKYLDIPFNYSVFSEDRMGIHSVGEPDEWALEISKKMGASIYINPPGGKAFFNKEKFDKVGIGLMFLTQKLSPYSTAPFKFVPGLSIIDVMMFNSPKEINKMLDEYDLE